MRIVLLLCASLFLYGCSSTKKVYHAVYTLDRCPEAFSQQQLVTEMMKKKFLHSSDMQGAYDVFFIPKIKVSGPLANERFTDSGGLFGMAVCARHQEFPAYVVVEELQPCPKQKNCTQLEQKIFEEFLNQKQCTWQVRNSYSPSWMLEKRQDWKHGGCFDIIPQL